MAAGGAGGDCEVTMGRKRFRPRGRPIDGILVLDKPVGMGSNESLQVVKRLFRARKAGHTGSLDRLASGLLPICMGEATKISGYLLNADKRYETCVRLGARTRTGDAEGEVIENRAVPRYSRSRVDEVLSEFVGLIEQIPPMHSAIKHQGQRLYKLAHQGIEVERKARQVRIHHLDLLDQQADRLFVDVKCSKGTYIRTLAEDIGERLGCGAHVEALRRLEAGPFDIDASTSLDTVRERSREGLEALDAMLLPAEAGLSDWPEVHIPQRVAYYLEQGQPVLVPHAPTDGFVRIYSKSGGFLGVGEVQDDGRIAPRRLLRRPSGGAAPD